MHTILQLTSSKLLLCLLFLSLFTCEINAQAQPCPASNNQWQWPTHANWYFGQAQKINFGATGNSAPTISTITGSGSPFPDYESCATASDESGNLVFFTNGVSVWDGTGASVAVPSGRLLTGAESPTGNAGSAVQGVLIVKHPLDIDNYYIFTTDDAIAGQDWDVNAGAAKAPATYGFNYYVYKKSTNTVTGPTRLKDAAGQNYRCTEQIAATLHSNGRDIWIVTHEATPTTAPKDQTVSTRNYFAYKLTCAGITNPTTPVVSNLGFAVTVGSDWQGHSDRSNERSSLQFSWDGTKAGATHHRGNGAISSIQETVSIMNFNNATGVLSNSVPIGGSTIDVSNPYDCEFSPSGNRLFVTFLSSPWDVPPINGKVAYFNLAAGNSYNLVANIATNVDAGSIKLGGDGRMYVGSFGSNPWAYRNAVGVVSNPDGAAALNTSGVTASNASVAYGLPNMFVPPRDYLKIRDTSISECDLPLDMGVKWKCKGTDAEDITIAGWAVKNTPAGGSINANTGVFNATGPGVYEVYYTICTIKDTALITVISCSCPVDLKVSQPKICIGNKVKLDSIVIAGPGVWSIDSVPTSAGTNPTLNISGGDTLFTSVTGNKIGTYKLLFKDPSDPTCRDSVYIIINPLPTPIITAFGPLCKDSVLTTMTLTPAIVGGTGQWYIDDVASTNQFDPTSGAISAGNHEAKYTHTDANGCINSDSITVNVIALKNATITQAGPYCSNAAAVTLTAATAGGVWSGTGITNPASGTFNPNNAGQGSHVITYSFPGLCNSQDTMTIVVNPVKDATLSIHDSTVCKTDPSVNINVFPAQAGGVWTIISPVGSAGVTTSPFNPANYAAGDYKIEYSLANPCGDKDTLTMHVIDQFDATISVTAAQDTVCQSAAPFAITKVNNGGTFWATCGACINATTGVFNPAIATAGNNTISYGYASNCGDTQTVKVFVLPVFTSVITRDTALCITQQYTPTNTWLPVDPATLGYLVPGTWKYVGAGNVAALNPVTGAFDANIAGAGTYKITYSVTLYPCYVPDTITIRVDAMPNPLVTPVSDMCANAAVKILAANTIGVWTTTAPAGTITGNNFNPATAGAGSWEVKNTVTNGKCSAWDTITINVKAVPVITLLPIPDQCMGGALVDLTPYDAPDTGVWSGTGVTGTNFNPAASGSVTLTYSISGLCPTSKTTTVTVQTTPNPIVSGDTSVCENMPGVQLSADKNGGAWVGTGINSTGYFSTTGLTDGDYPVQYQMNNVLCKDTGFYHVRILDVPVVDAYAVDPEVCFGEPLYLRDTSLVAGTNYLWNAIDANGGVAINQSSGAVSNSIINSNLSPGIYDLKMTVTFANGCLNSVTKSKYLTVNSFPNAQFVFTPTPASTLDPNVRFENTTVAPYDSLFWGFTAKGTPDTLFGSTADVADAFYVKFNSTNDDTIPVCLTVSNRGCKDTYCQDVIIRAPTTIFVPNAFSPNGDGINDIFYPMGQNFGEPGYEFMVFDRWGEMIFRTYNSAEGWNGKRDNNMRDAQIDVYVWKVVYKDHFTEVLQDPIVGHVSIIK